MALRLLDAGVPLSLLIDLVCGPDSEGIVASERAAPGSPARRRRLVTGLAGGTRSGERRVRTCPGDRTQTGPLQPPF
jgi:hypothetical protein